VVASADRRERQTAQPPSTTTDGPAAALAPAALSAADFSAAVSAITSAFGDPTRRAIYLYSSSCDDGVTASSVAQRFDLHANVARHHLEKLAAGGHLEVRGGRSGGGAGRPSKRYVASGRGTAIDLPVRHDELVLTLLARALELLPAEQAAAMAEEVGADYGRAMGSSLTPADAPRSLRAALTTVADALSAHGFAAHAEGRGGDGLQIVADHCPFGPAAVTSPVLCALERGVVKGMLAALYGTTDARTARSRAQGDATCVTAVLG
jgi:predicted ArsR family transcriptional regulator